MQVNCTLGADTIHCNSSRYHAATKAASAADSCRWAHNNACDDPQLCAAGTDTTDCAPAKSCAGGARRSGPWDGCTSCGDFTLESGVTTEATIVVENCTLRITGQQESLTHPSAVHFLAHSARLPHPCDQGPQVLPSYSTNTTIAPVRKSPPPCLRPQASPT